MVAVVAPVVAVAEIAATVAKLMDTKQFRAFAHQVVDWMADYLEDNEQLPVFPDIQPGDIRQQIPPSPPSQGEDFKHILEDFQRLIVPGMTHWNHPGWFAYFPANHSPPSVLAEMLTAAMGAQCMSWQTSPAATELEQVVLDWLRQMLKLDDPWVGCIQDTASSSTLVALLSARERITEHLFGQQGSAAPDANRLVVYASTEAHSSIDKAVKLSGIGLEQLRKIPVDKDFAMRPEALAASIQQDIKAGLRPTCVIATVGTTSSTAIDPLQAIGSICQAHNIWLHVDAAYGGSAAMLPEMRYILNGIEAADSLVFNPHKWMLTNFDCSAYFVRDIDTLLRTFRSDPEYLKTSYDPQVVNFRDWGIPLGRRFRALKLWFVLRSYGVEGLQQFLRKHISWAQELTMWVNQSPNFECLAPAPFALVCLRYHPPHLDEDDPQLDTLNQRILTTINERGRFHLTHTRLNNQYTIRVSIGQRKTTLEHVKALWQELQDVAEALPLP